MKKVSPARGNLFYSSILFFFFLPENKELAENIVAEEHEHGLYEPRHIYVYAQHRAEQLRYRPVHPERRETRSDKAARLGEDVRVLALEDPFAVRWIGKARRYGKEFCALIKRYCDDNEIERPEEMFVRTVAKDSMTKVKIIGYLDRRMPLDDIASALNLDFDDLLDEIDAIVYSGTKVNIDYFLEDVMDEDQVDDIYEYFRESDTDNIDDAMDELGYYEERDIRLVRIKFLSEQAN